MAGIRRAISNFGDVQIALNDIYTQLNNLTTQPQNNQLRILTGIPDPVNPTDAVNLETLQSYVAAQIAILAKTIPPKQFAQPLNATDATFNKNIIPKTTSIYSIGKNALTWLKGWFDGVNISSLTASKPLHSDASKNIVSGAISLTADVSGILPTANGGTGGTSLVISFNTRTGAITLTSSDISTAGGYVSGSTPTFGATILGSLTMIAGAILQAVQFAAGNTTGSGTALLGTNSPATVLTAPYKWVTVTAADGTTCYLPIWK